MVQKNSSFLTCRFLGAVVFGNFLYAVTVKLFLFPANLVTGGTTGIALAVQYFFSIPVSVFVLLFNLAMLLTGLCFLGKKFAVTTLASTFLYPLFLGMCEAVFKNLVITDDLLLCTVFSGLGIGCSLGLVVRAGASTGGMDIPPLVLQKLFRIPTSGSLFVLDAVVLLLQCLFQPVKSVLYGILLILLYTMILNKMLLIGSSRTEVKIVSDRSAEISHAILKSMDRGVTLLCGKGGYLHHEMQIILSVVSNWELIKVEKIVRQIDPDCFMIVTRVNEVCGHGFSADKIYR